MAQSTIDSGFGQALIQKQKTTAVDESTVFYFNIVVSAILCLLLCLCAPWIAVFYNVPELTSILRVYSLGFVIGSFGLVQQALLVKQLRFDRRMWAVFSSIVVSGAVGVTVAYSGFGVWALVFQALTMKATYVAVLWLLCPWRPVMRFSADSCRSLGKFGINVWLSGMLNTLFDKGYLVIIGKLYSVTELGLYQNAKQLVTVFSQALSTVSNQVNFPLLSKIQDDPKKVREVFKRVLRLTMLAVSPAMVGLGMTAPILVPLVFGKKWLPCVPYVQILCVTGFLFPIHLLNLGLLKALGRSDLFFRLEVVKKVLVVVAIATTYRFGVMGLLYGQVVTSVLALAINSYYTKRLLNVGLLLQFRWLVRGLGMAAAMGVVVYFSAMVPVGNLMLAVSIQVASGVVSYGLLLLVLRDDDTKYMFQMLLSKLGLMSRRSDVRMPQ